MTPIRLACFTLLLLIVLLAGALPGPHALAAIPTIPAGPAGSPEGISGSYVYLNVAISPDTCYRPGATQTFCMQAISHTGDWDYVYYLWLRFPSSWTIHNVYVYDVPYCVHGGTFGTFNWAEITPDEVRIQHVRYHANPSDTCTAYYCFEVTPGTTASPFESWYWQSSVFGDPPFNPCSTDGYTPAGQPACDESITPPAYIPLCPPTRVYLPAVVKSWP